MDSPLMEELDAITEGKSKLDLAEEIWRLRRAQPEAGEKVAPDVVLSWNVAHYLSEAICACLNLTDDTPAAQAADAWAELDAGWKQLDAAMLRSGEALPQQGSE